MESPDNRSYRTKKSRPDIGRHDIWFRFVLRDPQEAVKHIVRINVVSRDSVRRVVGDGDGALARACARTRSMERRDSAFRSPHVTVIHVFFPNVVSNNCAAWLDAVIHGALTGACARTRKVVCGDRAVRGAQVAVAHTA